MTNTLDHTFKRRGLIEQGKQLIPTRMIISYRLKEEVFATAATPPATGYVISAAAPVVRGWGICRNDSITPTHRAPVLLNENQSGGESLDVLLDSKDPDDYAGSYTGYFLECSQEIRFNTEWLIVGFNCEIHGIEHVARVREILLFGRYKDMEGEYEFRLV